MKKHLHTFALYLISLFLPVIASAHIGYVLSESEIKEHARSDFSFLLSPLHNPTNLFLILATPILLPFIYFILKKNAWFASRIKAVVQRTTSYYELIPWMLRLSLGIALIGAGAAKVFISPSLPGFSQMSFLQILLGFLLLAGFLLGPAVIVALILFIFAVFQNFYLLGNLDFFAGAIALFILASAKPGVDDLLGIPFFSPCKPLQKWVPLVLRVGIGGAMMFLAIYEKFLNPHLSATVVENYHLTSVIPVSPQMWVLSAGLIEFGVGLFLFLGFQTRLIAAIAFLVLTLSFFYFGEAVYSHVTLFGVLSILFVTGGGQWSIGQNKQVKYA